MKDGLLLVGTGTAIGLAAGMAVTWPLRGFLAGTTSGDPFTLGGVSTLLLLTGTLASLLPAHRASSIDPALTLRRD